MVNASEPGFGTGFSFTSSAPTGAGLFFGAQDSGGFTPVYIGTVGPICISDVSLADATALCTGGGGGGSATSTEATSSPEQTQENLFNGILVMLLSIFLTFYIMRESK